VLLQKEPRIKVGEGLITLGGAIGFFSFGSLLFHARSCSVAKLLTDPGSSGKVEKKTLYSKHRNNFMALNSPGL
jgi:hypothetical protein